jgi:phage N-6-adenine-methyltransferase
VSLSRVVFSSASNEWATPSDVYEALNDEFGFTYDPCPLWDGGLVSDGLLADWGAVTFCNPPYSDIANWVMKAWQQWRKGCTVVLLIPSRTDTRWWHDYVMKATEIRFIKGRLKFGGAATSAPFPSCVVVWRPAVTVIAMTPEVAR